MRFFQTAMVSMATKSSNSNIYLMAISEHNICKKRSQNWIKWEKSMKHCKMK